MNQTQQGSIAVFFFSFFFFCLLCFYFCISPRVCTPSHGAIEHYAQKSSPRGKKTPHVEKSDARRDLSLRRQLFLSVLLLSRDCKISRLAMSVFLLSQDLAFKRLLSTFVFLLSRNTKISFLDMFIHLCLSTPNEISLRPCLTMSVVLP